jgi:hypothetical protein
MNLHERGILPSLPDILGLDWKWFPQDEVRWVVAAGAERKGQASPSSAQSPFEELAIKTSGYSHFSETFVCETVEIVGPAWAQSGNLDSVAVVAKSL